MEVIMNFKQIIVFFLCFIMLFSFASCFGEGEGEVTDMPGATEAPAGSEVPATTEATETPETTMAPEKTDAKKSLKILAVGNSFSVDGMEYLYQIAKNAGVEEIILGNL